jgi:hypothetical protein
MNAETLAFQTEQHICIMRSLFGIHMGVGMQVGLPTIDGLAAHLGINYICYLIWCKSQLHVIRLRVPHRGLSFFIIFNGYDINIGIIYIRIIYNDLS